MNFALTFRLAVRALTRNKMRTLLTMLGIIIGVASVIAMLSIGNGARLSMEARINSMGTNLVGVRGGSRPAAGARGGQGSGLRLRTEDWQAVLRLPSVAIACPLVEGWVTIVYGSGNWRTLFTGSSANYLELRNWSLSKGRFFTEAEVRSASGVCVMGKVSAEKLFGGADPLNKTIRIGNFPYKVIGQLEEIGESGWGSSRDDVVVIPYTCAQRKVRGTKYVDQIIAQATDKELVRALQEQIVILLKQRFNCRMDDDDAFYSFNQADAAKMAEDSSRIFSLLLGGIASVSLLVGGIGIMNIMLVSVTERIREIGIRMAIGARGFDILTQFLVESVVLSLIGGTLGILLGMGVSRLIANMAGWPAVVSYASIIISFGFSAFVGVFFGFYPALQASKLDPIVALRNE